MLEKFLNKKVKVYIKEYGLRKGTITSINADFIELDNNIVIQIKYIIYVESI